MGKVELSGLALGQSSFRDWVEELVFRVAGPTAWSEIALSGRFFELTRRERWHASAVLLRGKVAMLLLSPLVWLVLRPDVEGQADVD